MTRVESFCEKRDSSRVTIFLNVTRIEFESPKIVNRVESLTRVTLSLQWGVHQNVARYFDGSVNLKINRLFHDLAKLLYQNCDCDPVLHCFLSSNT